MRRRHLYVSVLALGAALAVPGLPPVTAGAVPSPGTTERVSESVGGGAANGWSNRPVLSPDGSVVLFSSLATDLVPGPGAAWYLRDLDTGVTTAVTGVPGGLGNAQLTGDGSRIAFESGQSDLVPGDTNGKVDVFVRDVAAGTTVRASVDSTGAQYPAGTSRHAGISDDGRYVAFVTTTVQTASCQNNRVSVRDLVNGRTTIVKRCVLDARLSGDGRALVVMSDPGVVGCGYRLEHVVVATGVTTTIGCGTEPSISGNGGVVAFKAWGADGLTGMQAFDVRSGMYDRIDVSDAGVPSDGALGLVSSGPVLNGNGRLAVFAANATTLVPGDGSTADVYVRDLAAGTTRMVSVATDGSPGEQESIEPDISADGRIIAFTSRARDLVPGTDANNQPDVFVRHVPLSVCAAATDPITGTYGADWLRGTTGPDVFLGLAGDDTFNGLAGDDVLCGGSGSDTATYLDATTLVDVDLGAGTALGQGTDTLLSVENVEGSRFNDRLKGSAGPNRFLGLAGADAISGLAGDDWADGGPGNDKLYGYAGRDTLLGGPGNDLLSGGLDVDALDGGDGTDTCGGDPADTPVTGCEG